MKAQWDCLLQNLGSWHGSFTRFSPQGELVGETPTIVSLEGYNENRSIRQVVRRLTTPPEDTVLEYSTLSRSALFLETGAFSQGSMQFGPFSEFGAELGMIEVEANNQPGDRRLRLVQLFNKNSQLHQITLIREHREGTTATESPPLTVDDLIGQWQGEAVTVYPDWREPTTCATSLRLQREGRDRLTQQLTWGTTGQTLTSTATLNGSVLTFSDSAQPIQVLLLPGGASATGPTQLTPRTAFFLEAGWLLQPNLRQRLIRSYDNKGEWISLTLVTEHKVAA